MASVWRSRPAGLYGRRGDDWAYTTLCGAVAMLGGLSALSRWDPTVVPAVLRTTTAVVTERLFLTPDVVALTLADPARGLLPAWTPGAHIELQLPSGRRRQYSLCGPPGRRTDYRIAVRRLDAGRGGSREIHDDLTEGDRVVFAGPRNAFSLGASDRDVLFVIGGIGVTPILPMIQQVQSSGLDWQAVYAGRDRQHMPLLDQVLAAAPERVTVWADSEHGRPPYAADLLNAAGPLTAVYVCGPPGLIDIVRTARNAHVSAALRYERFSPGPVVNGAPFELQLASTGQVLDVPADRSALDVMIDNDPATPSSCRHGFCGTCRVKVLAGEVQRRGTATEAHDEMLVCVSRSDAGRVVIDI